MVQKYRRVVAVVFVLCAAMCGFGAGAWLGARFLVPPGSGLAGPVMVLGYGVVGAVIALGLAVCANWLLRGRAFLVIAAPVILGGMVVGAGLGYTLLKSHGEQQSYLANQRATLPVFDLELTYDSAESATAGFARFDYDGTGHRITVTGFNGVACAGELSPTSEEKLALLVALRQVEGLLVRQADPCVDDNTAATIGLEFHIREHLPPDTRGELGISKKCLSRHMELGDAIASIEAVEKKFRSRCR